MTPLDLLRYRRALEGWRGLAERRLEQMLLMRESGRWRRYFSENEFDEVIRQSGVTVELWRKLVPDPAATAQVVAFATEPLNSEVPDRAGVTDPSENEVDRQRCVA